MVITIQRKNNPISKPTKTGYFALTTHYMFSRDTHIMLTRTQSEFYVPQCCLMSSKTTGAETRINHPWIYLKIKTHLVQTDPLLILVEEKTCQEYGTKAILVAPNSWTAKDYRPGCADGHGMIVTINPRHRIFALKKARPTNLRNFTSKHTV